MQEGRAEGSASLLLRQLGRRFGRLPAPVRDRVRAATADDLEAWAMAVLDAGSLDAVFKGGGLTGKRTAGPPPGAAARPVPHFRLTHPAAECGGALPAACGGTGGPRRSRCSRTASAIQRWGLCSPGTRRTGKGRAFPEMAIPVSNSTSSRSTGRSPSLPPSRRLPQEHRADIMYGRAHGKVSRARPTAPRPS